MADWLITIFKPEGGQTQFSPNPLDPVNAQSDTVRWGNRTNEVHEIAIAGVPFTGPLQPGDSSSLFTPQDTGPIPYNCVTPGHTESWNITSRCAASLHAADRPRLAGGAGAVVDTDRLQSDHREASATDPGDHADRHVRARDTGHGRYAGAHCGNSEGGGTFGGVAAQVRRNGRQHEDPVPSAMVSYVQQGRAAGQPGSAPRDRDQSAAGADDSRARRRPGRADVPESHRQDELPEVRQREVRSKRHHIGRAEEEHLSPAPTRNPIASTSRSSRTSTITARTRIRARPAAD